MKNQYQQTNKHLSYSVTNRCMEIYFGFMVKKKEKEKEKAVGNPIFYLYILNK